MSFLLDTNVISNLRRHERADPNLRRWIDGRRDEELFISVICILEIENGMLRLRRHDETQAKVLEAWMHRRIIPRFASRILTLDTATALQCAALHVPNPRPERDAWIAATALVHGLTVVTRNVRDFLGTGVKLVNPWDA